MTIQTDKIAHASLSAAIVFTLAPVTGLFVAVATTAFLGLSKEVIDELTYGGFDTQDLMADVLGILFAAIVLITAHFLHISALVC